MSLRSSDTLGKSLALGFLNRSGDERKLSKIVPVKKRPTHRRRSLCVHRPTHPTSPRLLEPEHLLGAFYALTLFNINLHIFEVPFTLEFRLEQCMGRVLFMLEFLCGRGKYLLNPNHFLHFSTVTS